MPKSKQTRTIIVWDSPVRLFHWLLAVLIPTAWLTAEFDVMEWHGRVGQMILTLVIFRIFWGFVGSETARFASFLKEPVAVLAYVRRLMKAGYHSIIGHNPMGGWAVMAMLFVILGQAMGGLFANDDILYEGPLYHLAGKELSQTITSLHEVNFYFVLLPLIALHLAASLFYWRVKKQNLVGPMITGKKPAEDGVSSPKQESLARALLCFMAAAGLVYSTVTWL